MILVRIVVLIFQAHKEEDLCVLETKKCILLPKICINNI